MGSLQRANPCWGLQDTGPALKDGTIERLYKLQLFIVIVVPLLLLIINKMLGNSLARE